jgi:hypothetical protein
LFSLCEKGLSILLIGIIGVLLVVPLLGGGVGGARGVVGCGTARVGRAEDPRFANSSCRFLLIKSSLTLFFSISLFTLYSDAINSCTAGVYEVYSYWLEIELNTIYYTLNVVFSIFITYS